MRDAVIFFEKRQRGGMATETIFKRSQIFPLFFSCPNSIKPNLTSDFLLCTSLKPIQRCFPEKREKKKKGIQTFSEASFFFLAQRETVWAELAATPACLKARRVSASALKQLD